MGRLSFNIKIINIYVYVYILLRMKCHFISYHKSIMGKLDWIALTLSQSTNSLSIAVRQMPIKTNSEPVQTG